MTDAEVRELMALHSDENYTIRSPSVVALARDYLALKAAVRLVHGEPSFNPLPIWQAQTLLEQVAKESPCPSK